MSLTETLAAALTSLATITTTTVALATGGMLSIAASLLLVEALRHLLNYFETHPPKPNFPLSEKDKPSPNDKSEDAAALRVLPAIVTGLGYFFYLVVLLACDQNVTVLSQAIDCTVMVVGVASGLAVTVAMGMGLLKCAELCGLIKD